MVASKRSARLRSEPGAEVFDTDATPTPAFRAQVSVREERWQAAKLAREAIEVVAHTMDRVRQGKALEPARLEHLAERIIASLARNPDALRSLGRVRFRDRYTFEHAVSVAVLAGSFGLALDLGEGELHDLVLAGLLHDVGKARVPLAILNKPGALDPGETEIMRHHVVDSRLLLEDAGLPAAVIRGAAQHHERHDGGGYPYGLAGDAISLFGRIVGISDVYDAVTADRVYRRGQTPTRVLRRLLNTADREFETSLVHRFIQTVGIYPVGTLVRLESGRLAVVLERGERDLLRPLVRVFYDGANRQFLAPTDLDLARDPDLDSIVSSELPAWWGVKPHLYMD
ncbi:MAG: HD-GYP domain-containing protein [Thiohalomonadaceae bacterium]